MCVVHSPLNGGSADQQADRVILTRYLATTSVPTLFERIIKNRLTWLVCGSPLNYHPVLSPATCLSNGFTARMCAIPGVTYKYGLSPKLAVSLVVCVINFGFTARMCAIPGVT
jgi:hypothetical protein